MTIHLTTNDPEEPQMPAVTLEGPAIEHRRLRCLLSREQAAEVLSVSTDTIDRLVKSAKLAAVRVGGQVRFMPDDLEAFITRNRTEEAA